jgi:hypothetical protein
VNIVEPDVTAPQPPRVEVARLYAALAVAVLIAGALAFLLFRPSRTRVIAPVALSPRPAMLDELYVRPEDSVVPKPTPANSRSR